MGKEDVVFQKKIYTYVDEYYGCDAKIPTILLLFRIESPQNIEIVCMAEEVDFESKLPFCS